ncbi:MAG: hypothetical protein NW201_12980 [Gemmatimonadales bacterium]|nr:hypothetical protein [Gemmatimonadales bacterium]
MDEELPFDPGGPGEGDAEEVPTAVAATERGVPLRVDLVEDERTPEGMLCMATFIGERMIARSVLSAQAWDVVGARGIFAEPRPVALVAREAPPGLQCQLFAMVPAEMLRDAEEEQEPWAASVPGSSYEASVSGGGEDDAEGPPVLGFPLGIIVRFQKDRAHPDNLALEAVDVLRRVIEGRTVEPIDRALDDLLG